MLLETITVAVLSVTSIDTQTLERYYWDCDTAYMQEQLSGQDVNTCLSVTEELKTRLSLRGIEFMNYWHKHKTGEWLKRGYKDNKY